MDDELESPGLSGWAGFALGRMSVQSELETEQLIGGLFNRRASPVDMTALVTQNNALADENARLRQALDDYRYNYDRLKAWADHAEKRIKTLKGELASK